MAKVLIACEESQRVCTAFRELGHEAYSCDIQEPSGGHPEWHILGDVLKVLNPDDWNSGNDRVYHGIVFTTMAGEQVFIDGKWDLIVAHPPCTYLSCAATQMHSLKRRSYEQINERMFDRINSMCFFIKLATADCDRIAIENPVGVMNSAYRKPEQIIEPYWFGEPFKKKTCLWLKGLPLLHATNLLDKDNAENTMKHGNWFNTGGKERQKNRSKTFIGIAKAMAEQWGGIL